MEKLNKMVGKQIETKRKLTRKKHDKNKDKTFNK